MSVFLSQDIFVTELVEKNELYIFTVSEILKKDTYLDKSSDYFTAKITQS